LNADIDEHELVGMLIVKNALKSCTQQILDNCGEDSKAKDTLGIIYLHKEQNFGYNANTRKVEDLVKAKIIDPKKVARCALENAASVAGTFLTFACGIYELPDQKEEDLSDTL